MAANRVIHIGPRKIQSDGNRLYFGTVSFAPRIHAPVLASTGFIETTSPPPSIWTVLNQIPGRKEVITMIEFGSHRSNTRSAGRLPLPGYEAEWRSLARRRSATLTRCSSSPK
jgi:hypothetical protein